MIVKTSIFEFWDEYYNNLSELALAMGISVSQIYRVREGSRYINQKFIVGAMKAFPNHKLDDLFYLTRELPTVANDYRHQHLATPSPYKPATKEKQLTQGSRQIIESAV